MVLGVLQILLTQVIQTNVICPPFHRMICLHHGGVRQPNVSNKEITLDRIVLRLMLSICPPFQLMICLHHGGLRQPNASNKEVTLDRIVLGLMLSIWGNKEGMRIEDLPFYQQGHMNLSSKLHGDEDMYSNGCANYIIHTCG